MVYATVSIEPIKVIYFYAEDEAHYTKLKVSELKNTYQIDEIIMLPDIGDITDGVRSGKKIALMAPYLPNVIDKRFDKTNFFEYIHLKNTEGVLTSGQKKAEITEEEALREKLGINIYKSSLTLKDYGGAELLIEEAKKAEIKEKFGFPIKGFMLAGIPGTGKSFFAKCFAGETNRLLVELNLSQFMEQDDTIFKINMIFEYFIKNPGRYILWIDEIEKMMVGEKAQQVLGVLLTRINDLNSFGGSNLFIIATANNITDIAKKNPEFLRNGRFDLLLFMLPPTEKNAVNIFNMYIKKAKESFIKNTMQNLIENAFAGDLESIGTNARVFQEKILAVKEQIATNDVNSKKIAQEILDSVPFLFDSEKFVIYAMVIYRPETYSDRFIYTPAEIQYIVDDVFFSFYFRPKNADSDEQELLYESLVQKYLPLQVTLSSSLDAMKGVASNFVQI